MRVMGSLPNLHELSSGYVDLALQNELFAKTLQEKGVTVNLKKPNHRPLYQTRSLGSNPNSCIVNPRLLKRLSYDKSDFNAARRSRSLRSGSVIPGPLQSVGASSLHQNVKHISRQASVSSSTGTSSVRKLIAVVRSTPSHVGPIYSRPIISQNFVALCLSHGMFTVAFVPIIILQGSISAWWISSDGYFSYNTGSLLLAGLYLVATISAIVSPFVAHKVGVTKCLVSCYALTIVFGGVHLYPKPYLLVPAYVVMGLSVGHLNTSTVTYLIMLASKLKFVLSEEEENELQNEPDSSSTKRETLAQILFRGLSFAQNVGLIAGGMVAYFLIQWTATGAKNEKDPLIEGTCGYESCPRSGFFHSEETNKSANASAPKLHMVLPCKTSTILAGVFLSFCVVSTAVAILIIHRLRICYNYGPAERSKFENRARAIKDTFHNPKLKFITPLLIFIGIEQGFMYADFTKFYVICVMGIQNAPLIFISLGLLQAIAGITLSLLVHHIRRYFIIGVGFVFQACLLLVLILWKPTSDDSALFYVISATWGVCNAIWDSVTFCFLVSLFPDFWEFPFSHHFFFRYVGLSVAFAYHGFLCTSVKLYIMCVMLLLAVFPYAWLEMKLDARSRKSLVSTWHR